VQLSTVRFNITVDGNKASTSTDLNDFVYIGVVINGANAGNVVFVTDQQTGNSEAFIQYLDKTKQGLDDVLHDLIQQIRAVVF
jgi:hypothetical protein